MLYFRAAAAFTSVLLEISHDSDCKSSGHSYLSATGSSLLVPLER